jgi:hypothetical protein
VKREKDIRNLSVHKDVKAAIRAEAAARGMTLEAVVAERFGAPISPGRPNPHARRIVSPKLG